MFQNFVGKLALISGVFLMAGCAFQDRSHKILVSVPDQKMRVFEHGTLLAEYPVSTSKFGLGGRPGSNATPLGKHRIRKKIGDDAPMGAVFKSRRRTGEILPPNARGRDPIVTRILWLDGIEPTNSRSFTRHIYIHGTTEENRIGSPASYGCIRMTSADVVQLFDLVGPGTQVNIINQPLPDLRNQRPPTSIPNVVEETVNQQS